MQDSDVNLELLNVPFSKTEEPRSRPFWSFGTIPTGAQRARAFPGSNGISALASPQSEQAPRVWEVEEKLDA